MKDSINRNYFGIVFEKKPSEKDYRLTENEEKTICDNVDKLFDFFISNKTNKAAFKDGII